MRAVHDYRARALDTLFGRVRVRAPRIRLCDCWDRTNSGHARCVSPLSVFFPGRATPEMRLQTELGARHSFREAARLMATFLPCATVRDTTVRNRLGRFADELDAREDGAPTDSQRDEASGGPITVFIDGAHIRCRPEYQRRHLDVVVGKIEGGDACRRFGPVAHATAAARHVRQELTANGWRHGDPLTVISDGEPASPTLVRNATRAPVAHILDWWRVSMRVQHVETAVKGLVETPGFADLPSLFMKPSQRLRWSLWRGRIQLAGAFLRWLIADCRRLRGDATVTAAAQRAKAPRLALCAYLTSNMDALINYGAQHRRGLPVSTSRAEGCVDDVANTRMGKRRRMRWSPRGAQRVAVARAAVLDGRLTISHRTSAA